MPRIVMTPSPNDKRICAVSPHHNSLLFEILLISLYAVFHRCFTFALVVFEAFFLNVVIPGHQRGIVQLPGTHSEPIATCPFCCDGESPSHSRSKSGVPGGPAGTCAICSFAAHLILPPVVDFSLPPLKLLGPVSDEIAKAPIARIVLVPFDGRAPPPAV
jgi:hypothetical protein